MIDPDSDEALMSQLRAWQVAPLEAGAHERIISKALAGRQTRPWWSSLLHEIELSLTDWRYHLGYKVVILTGCLVIGATVGFNAFETTNVTDLAFMRDIGAPS